MLIAYFTSIQKAVSESIFKTSLYNAFLQVYKKVNCLFTSIQKARITSEAIGWWLQSQLHFLAS